MVSSDLNLPDCLYLYTVFFKCMVDTGEYQTFFMMDNTEEESRFLVNISEKNCGGAGEHRYRKVCSMPYR